MFTSNIIIVRLYSQGDLKYDGVLTELCITL